jgi:epsilon-lactone hydrolase
MKKEARELLEQIKSEVVLEERDPAKLRQNFDELLLSFPSTGLLKIREEEDAPVPSYWIVTPQSSQEKVLLFFHGGLFNMGSTHSHQDLCQRLSRTTGCSIFSVDYRLAPQHPFPAALEDCLDSYLWLVEEGFQPQDIVLTGISAGGNLALSTLLALKREGEQLPQGVVGLSPILDLTFPVVYQHLKDVQDWISYDSLDKLIGSYLWGQNPTNFLLSPVYGDLEGLPPIFLQAGSCELLLCDVNRFRDLAIDQEVKVNLEVWQGMFHAWQMFPSRLPEAEQSLESVGEFVHQL